MARHREERPDDAGVDIAVDGDDLLLTAPAQPPAAIVDMLARHKAELVALLRPRPDDRTIEDWQAYFDEWAAIVEYDGGFSRPDAETWALDCCIAEWLRRNPVCSFSSCCLGCGGLEGAHEVLPLFRTETPGQAWLQSRCWPAWSAARRNSAIAALSCHGGEPGDERGINAVICCHNRTAARTQIRRWMPLDADNN